MRGLWLHVRNSPIRLALPILIIVDLAVLFLRNRHWIGTWPETGAAAQVPAYLLGVIGAGAAAWAASAPTRHGLAEQMKAGRVHPVVSEAHRMGATLIVLLVPYLIGQAVAFAVTAWTFPPGVHLWLGYLALGLFVILSAVTLGWACGKILGPVFAALAAAAGFLFLAALVNRWTDFIVITGRPEVAVEPLPVALRLGAVVALLVTLLWLPVADPLRQHGRKALLPVPAALTLAAVMFTTHAVADRQPPGDRALCVEGRTALCIWPEHQKYVPQLRELNTRISQLPESFVPPPRINQFGLEQLRYIGLDGKEHTDYEAGAPFFYILEGSPWSYAGDIRTAITQSTFGFTDAANCDWGTLSDLDVARIWAFDAWLEAYLVGGGSPDYRTNAPRQMQEAWVKGRAVAGWASRTEQFGWAEREVGDLRGRYCQPEN